MIYNNKHGAEDQDPADIADVHDVRYILCTLEMIIWAQRSDIRP